MPLVIPVGRACLSPSLPACTVNVHNLAIHFPCHASHYAENANLFCESCARKSFFPFTFVDPRTIFCPCPFQNYQCQRHFVSRCQMKRQSKLRKNFCRSGGIYLLLFFSISELIPPLAIQSTHKDLIQDLRTHSRR